MSVSIQKWADAVCGQSVGQLIAYPVVDAMPYTLSWSNGSTGAEIDHLPAGTYTVTVTDANGQEATATETILDVPDWGYWGFGDPFITPGYHCPGDPPYAVLEHDPFNSHEPTPASFPGAVTWDVMTRFGISYYYVWIDDTPGSFVTVDWTDMSGCPGRTQRQLSSEKPAYSPAFAITGACNGTNGTLTISGIPGQSMYYLHDPNGQAVGTYSNDFAGFELLGPGGYWVLLDIDPRDSDPRDPAHGYFECVDPFYVEVPDISGNCGRVTGRVFFDRDQDCAWAADEPGIPYRVVEFLPGPQYAITSSDGIYDRYMGQGDLTVSVQGTDLFPICPAAGVANVTVSNGSTVQQDFADSSLTPLDVRAYITAGAARPGFQQNIWLGAANPTARVSGPLDVVLTVDPQFTFLSAVPTPTSVVGNTITWSGLAALDYYGSRQLHVLAQVPADVGLIGQPYTHAVTVTRSVPEAGLGNNTAMINGMITGSFDPNEKRVRTSSGISDGSYYIGEDEWIEYTVGFQNTGTDTAFTVVVRDALPMELDLGSYEQGIASHPFSVRFLPNNVVEWRFANILLPDSNVNEPLSHGQVSFRIRPKAPVVPGTVITNHADIYFDFNPPIRTNDAVLTMETSTGIAMNDDVAWRLAPNPATDRVQVVGAVASGMRYTLIAADGRVATGGVLGTDRRIDVAALAKGLYILRLVQGDAVRQLRFVKD